jgi:hypothetical protein
LEGEADEESPSLYDGAVVGYISQFEVHSSAKATELKIKIDRIRLKIYFISVECGRLIGEKSL